MVSSEDYGHDLESAQGLVIKHDALEVSGNNCWPRLKLFSKFAVSDEN